MEVILGVSSEHALVVPGDGCKRHPKTFINPTDQIAQHDRKEGGVRDSDKRGLEQRTPQPCSKGGGSEGNEIRSGRGNADFSAGTCGTHGDVCGTSAGSDNRTQEAESAVANPLTDPLVPVVSCYPGQSTTNSKESSLDEYQGIILPVSPDAFFYLTGRGEKGRDCGDMKTLFSCDNSECRKPIAVPFHCKRRACPECYKIWIKDETAKIEARLRSPEALKRHRGKRLVEIILSPEQSDYGKPQTKKEVLDLSHDGYRYIKDKGALGGTAIYHHFRATALAKTHSIAEDKKTWAWIREQPRPADYYYISPHFHLTVFVGYMQPPEKGEKWVYKMITRRGKDGKRHVVDFLSVPKKELRKEIYYLLTHSVVLAGAEETFHSVRWFGSCSYNKFKATPQEKEIVRWEEGRKCEECGAGVVPFWTFVRQDVYDIRNGLKDPPKYWDEIKEILAKADQEKAKKRKKTNACAAGVSDRADRHNGSAMRGKCELCGALVNLVFFQMDNGKKLAVCRICKNEEERKK